MRIGGIPAGLWQGMAGSASAQRNSPAVAQPVIANNTAGEVSGTAQAKKTTAFCQTCAERTYQDGSDDMGVSFKNGGHISPNVSASVVAGHEQEHASRAQDEAREEGQEANVKVRLSMAQCPECGRMYISGGVTEVSKAAKKLPESQQLLGILLDEYI